MNPPNSQTGTISNTIDVGLGITSPATNLTFTIAASTTLTVSGNITGVGDLNKNGAGTVTLSGNNTYTGLTNINAGTLKVLGTSASVPVNLSNVSGGLNIADTNHVKASSYYSPDDRAPQQWRRFRDYLSIGVRHVVLLDPEEETAFRCEPGALVETRFTDLELPTGRLPF